eukprot:m.125969 g.125969  ORF g.125969 m.125969 type:complete len:75 (-) comp14684_c1_seq1:143-367(-)
MAGFNEGDTVHEQVFDEQFDEHNPWGVGEEAAADSEAGMLGSSEPLGSFFSPAAAIRAAEQPTITSQRRRTAWE